MHRPDVYARIASSSGFTPFPDPGGESIENQRVEDSCCLCSKPVVILVAITMLAVAILGAFALVGVFHPTGTFGVLDGIFGRAGSISMLAGGLAVFATILIARYCCKKDTTSTASSTQATYSIS